MRLIAVRDLAIPAKGDIRTYNIFALVGAYDTGKRLATGVEGENETWAKMAYEKSVNEASAKVKLAKEIALDEARAYKEEARRLKAAIKAEFGS